MKWVVSRGHIVFYFLAVSLVVGLAITRLLSPEFSRQAFALQIISKLILLATFGYMQTRIVMVVARRPKTQ